MHPLRAFTPAVLFAAGALALAACSSSSNNPMGPKAPPDSVQTQIAQSVAAEIQADVASFTQFGPNAFLNPFGLSPDIGVRRGLATLQSLGRRPSADGVHALFTQNCPAVSPSVPADEDADGVPDLATFTYTTQDCTESAGNETVTLTGSWVAGDSTPNTADLDDNEQIHHILVTETGGQSAFTIAADGGYAIAETPGTVTDNLNYWLALNETAPQSVHDSLSASGGIEFDFSPSGNPLIENSQLPAGTLHFNVTEAFVVNGQSQTEYSFTIVTTGLTIDPACLSTVTAGVVTVTFATSAVETITWSGCGAYTISKA